MKKNTAIILSISLVVAILAIAVIATFPTYIFEEPKRPTGNIHSDIINPPVDSENSDGPEAPGELGIDDGYLSNDEEDGIESLLPGIDNVQGDLPTAPEKDVEKGLEEIAKISSATLLAEKNAFGADVKVKLKKLGIFNMDYYRAGYYTESFAKNYRAYKYSATKDGKDFNSFGAAKLVINVPGSYNIENVGIAYLFDDYVEILDYTINQQDRSVSVPVNTTGVYILFEYKPFDEIELPTESDTSSNTSSNSSDESSSTPSDNSSTPSQDTPSSDTSSGNTSSTTSDPDRDTMDGWLPWS